MDHLAGFGSNFWIEAGRLQQKEREQAMIDKDKMVSYHGSVQHVLQYFTWEHLPEKLQAVSKPFAELAERVADASSSPETTVALRKLLEAKDAAVRASL